MTLILLVASEGGEMERGRRKEGVRMCARMQAFLHCGWNAKHSGRVKRFKKSQVCALLAPLIVRFVGGRFSSSSLE